MRYVPLLKGKKGELDALAHIAPDTRAALTPLVELVPGTEDDDQEVRADIQHLVDKVAESWGLEQRILLDVGRVSPEALEPGPTAVAELLTHARRGGVLAVPVLRLSDPVALVEAVRDGHAQDGRGACVRVQGEDLREDPQDLAVWLTSARRDLAMRPEHLDLIFDFGVVTDDTATSLAAVIARQCLRYLPEPNAWRSVTVAAGAFPADLSGFQPWVLGEVPRRDANLWRSVAATRPPRLPDFGDYAIAHPLLAAGVPFAPPPQLRYAAADRWLVLKGRRRDERANGQFFDICRAVADRPEFTPGLGWADTRVAEAAAQRGGPGNGTTWRSIGTGHHMDLVVDRLRARHEP